MVWAIQHSCRVYQVGRVLASAWPSSGTGNLVLSLSPFNERMLTFFAQRYGPYNTPARVGTSGWESISLGLAKFAAGRLELDGATPDNHTDKDLYVLLSDDMMMIAALEIVILVDIYDECGGYENYQDFDFDGKIEKKFAHVIYSF